MDTDDRIAQGLACARCGGEDGTMRPTGDGTPASSTTFAHDDCEVTA